MKHAHSINSLAFILCAIWASSLLVGCAPQNQTPSKTLTDTKLDSRVAPAPEKPAAPPTEQTQTEDLQGTVAKVGVGKKGHSYGGGIITEPASVYWRAKEKIAFEIQIPHALDLYKALSASGKGPSSHEAFMKDIIQANKVELPELPAGLTYQYDPKTELLMVVGTATESSAKAGPATSEKK